MAYLTTFAVGPSQIYPQVAGFYQEAFEEGFPQQSHRSKAFMAVFEKAVSGLRKKLSIPADYAIFFTGSATECWEMLSQAYGQSGAFHAYSGSFGEKWFEYGKAVAPDSAGNLFGANDDTLEITGRIQGTPGLLALTLNETSNGTALPFSILNQVVSAHPDAILAVDTTSIMAGIDLPWQSADVWFASVQKCFGLPAGMAVVVASPKAVSKARSAPGKYYNTVASYLEFAEICQTPFTPNMLGIYSMARLMEALPHITEVDSRLRRQAERLYDWVDEHPRLKPVVSKTENRSVTVLAVEVPNGTLAQYQEAASRAGYELGRGYGPWRETTFRIANFPAVEARHTEALLKVLDSVS